MLLCILALYVLNIMITLLQEEEALSWFNFIETKKASMHKWRVNYAIDVFDVYGQFPPKGRSINLLRSLTKFIVNEAVKNDMSSHTERIKSRFSIRIKRHKHSAEIYSETGKPFHTCDAENVVMRVADDNEKRKTIHLDSIKLHFKRTDCGMEQKKKFYVTCIQIEY